jgi:hypothetical protein
MTFQKVKAKTIKRDEFYQKDVFFKALNEPYGEAIQ